MDQDFAAQVTGVDREQISAQVGDNRALQTSKNLVVSAAVIFALTFLAMWAPVYVARNEFGLLLWPLYLLALVVVWLLALAGTVRGIVGYRESDGASRNRDRALIPLIGGLALLTLSGPVLWFGNAPLLMWDSLASSLPG